MTLADFARQIGISPATARQWKKRGKIIWGDGEYELIAEAQREWVGVTARDAGVTVGNLITDGSGVTSKVTGVTVDCDGGVTVTSKWPYEPLPLVTDCPVCHGARWACGHTPIEELTQIELLTKDNRILSDAVDSLRDLTAEHGMALSQALRRIADLETEVAFLRTRLGQPDPPVVISTTSSRPIDPPSFGWGA